MRFQFQRGAEVAFDANGPACVDDLTLHYIIALSIVDLYRSKYTVHKFVVN